MESDADNAHEDEDAPSLKEGSFPNDEPPGGDEAERVDDSEFLRNAHEIEDVYERLARDELVRKKRERDELARR